MNKKILELISAGFDINFGRVSIAYVSGAINRIQVFSDDYRFKYSAVYDIDDMETAVDKFHSNYKSN